MALAYARTATEVCLCLTIDYGQRAAARETAAAAALAAYYQAPHQILPLPFLGEISGNALVYPDAPLPEPELTQLDDPDTSAANMAQVWIPNRNGLLVNIAAAFAEAYGAEVLVAGFNREEAKAFPDNSEAFVTALNKCLAYSVRPPLQVISYTQRLNKVEIIKLGQRLAVPLQYIWSCYRGGRQMCGQCESCARLKRAAGKAGLAQEIFFG